MEGEGLYNTVVAFTKPQPVTGTSLNFALWERNLGRQQLQRWLVGLVGPTHIDRPLSWPVLLSQAHGTTLGPWAPLLRSGPT